MLFDFCALPHSEAYFQAVQPTSCTVSMSSSTATTSPSASGPAARKVPTPVKEVSPGALPQLPSTATTMVSILGQQRPQRSSARSSNIPLPPTHVTRTPSELQLSQDEELAAQKEAAMFYRLLNGIRQRQQQAAVRGYYQQHGVDIVDHPIVTQPDAPSVSPTANTGATASDWCMLRDTQGRVSDVQSDDWSIGGYDEDQAIDSSAAERTPALDDNDDIIDEGIFELEL